MGQFMDHDMTFDTTSVLGVPTDPARSPNTRIPTFDLDSVYLDGPFAVAAPVQLAAIAPSCASDDRFDDRAATSRTCRATRAGNAIIGDPRNDENIILAGLHAAFLKFHNNMVDMIRSERQGRRYATTRTTSSRRLATRPAGTTST